MNEKQLKEAEELYIKQARAKVSLMVLLVCSTIPLVAGSQVSLAGLIDVPKDFPKVFSNVQNKTFTFQLAPELQKVRERILRGEGGKGFQMAARIANDGAVSIWTDDTTGYPMMALIKGKNGNTTLSVPGVLILKVNLEPGTVIHADGFEIQSTREIKVGESVPALCVNGDVILSTEAAGDAPKSNSQRTPAVRISSSAAKNQATAIAAWRFETALR